MLLQLMDQTSLKLKIGVTMVTSLNL